MKAAICVGINDYSFIGPNTSLRGCITDAREWAALLADYYHFDEIHLLFDGSATPAGLQGALSRLAERAAPGDEVVLTYSGHGTRVPDADGDEHDGYDEAIVLSGAVYTDDQLAGDLKMFPAEVRVVVVADSCHSGTVTRSLHFSPVPPSFTRYADLSRALPDAPKPDRLHHRFGQPHAENRILLAGCKATQTSADAWLDGDYHGALTFHATRLLREYPWRTWADFGRLLVPRVHCTSTQTPQLEGCEAMLSAPVFS